MGQGHVGDGFYQMRLPPDAWLRALGYTDKSIDWARIKAADADAKNAEDQAQVRQMIAEFHQRYDPEGENYKTFMEAYGA